MNDAVVTSPSDAGSTVHSLIDDLMGQLASTRAVAVSLTAKL